MINESEEKRRSLSSSFLLSKNFPTFIKLIQVNPRRDNKTITNEGRGEALLYYLDVKTGKLCYYKLKGYQIQIGRAATETIPITTRVLCRFCINNRA